MELVDWQTPLANFFNNKAGNAKIILNTIGYFSQSC